MQLACPDTWKDGSRNSTVGKGRPLATNGLIRKSNKKNPYSSSKCETCKKPLHQQGKYCHGCAYSKGETAFLKCLTSFHLGCSWTSSGQEQ